MPAAGADKIFNVLADFIAKKTEPLIFFLEVSVSSNCESADEHGCVKNLHKKDVLYITLTTLTVRRP